MRRLGTRDLIGIFFAVVMTLLTILSMDRYQAIASGEPGLFYTMFPDSEGLLHEEFIRLKGEFAAAAGIQQFHNEIYDTVGADFWETEVKRTLYPRLLRRMATDTGIIIPSDEQIIDWAREHPDSVRDVFKSYLPKEPE